MTRIIAFTGLASALLLAPTAGWAHDGAAGGSGFAAGLAHPLTGIDHAFLLIAVGVWAALRGGNAPWAAPAAFVAAMAAGGLAGMAGLGLPGMELVLALSAVLVGGLALGAASRAPRAACLAVFAGFAAIHGLAHGAEMPLAAAPAAFAGGFLAASAALMGVGIGIGRAARPRAGRASAAA